MGQPKKSWWSLTRTRGQSLLLGVLWVVVGVLQLTSLVAGERGGWWRWASTALLIAMAGYYLLAWWVRGRRERTAPVD